MNGFVELHGESITGVIETFDRVIFKGHFNGFFPDGAFGRYLSRRSVLLKDAGRFFEAETQRIRDHVVSLAAAAERPVEYLAGASTHRSGTSKEARARAIAERDGVTQGLVCVLSVLEPCRSFAVAPNRQTRRLEVVRRPRKCLHYYLYLIDPEFGWMHVRLQTWAPYEIQVYVNGREWLARQLDAAGIGYRRSDNKITAVDDLAAVAALCQRFAHTDWPPFLERQATLVNPLLPAITHAGFSGYWWVIDQCEYASDILFTERAALETIQGDLVTAAITALGATEVMHFLGRKPHPAFAGEVCRRGHDRQQEAGARLPGALPPQGHQVLRSRQRVPGRHQQSARVQGAPVGNRRPGAAVVLCQDDATASCWARDGGRPSGAALQEEASNCHELLKAAVVNVMVKRRGCDCVMYGSGRRAQAN